MWVMTTEGFYSVVKHRHNRHWLLVRARAKEDLEKLVERIDQLPSGLADGRPLRGQIRSVSPSDYEYRMWVERVAMARIMDEVTSTIDYDNFKSAVSRRHSWERHDIYSRVWGVLLSIAPRRYSYGTSSWHQPRIFGRDYDRPSLRGSMEPASSDELSPFIDGARGLQRDTYETDFEVTDEELEIIEDFERRHGITEIGDVAEAPRPRHGRRRGKKKEKKGRFPRGLR